MVDNEMPVKNFTNRKVSESAGQISLDQTNCRLKTAFRAPWNAVCRRQFWNGTIHSVERKKDYSYPQ